jgi:hypothetical protein
LLHGRWWLDADGVTGAYGRVYEKNTGRRLMLSNNHVLADSNYASIGDPIVQPGPLYDGQVPRDQIANLYRFGLLNSGLTMANANTVDVALGLPAKPEFLGENVLNIGVVTEAEDAQTGQTVVSSGMHGYAEGEVVDTNATIKVGSYAFGSALFTDQIIVALAVSVAGNSGSVLVAKSTKRAVGLVFSGNSQYSAANKMTSILDTFGLSLSPIPGLSPPPAPQQPDTGPLFPQESLELPSTTTAPLQVPAISTRQVAIAGLFAVGVASVVGMANYLADSRRKIKKVLI